MNFLMRQNALVSNPRKLLGIRLGSALAEAGLTKVAFAQDMGVDPSAVTKWVRGDNVPSDKALQWLSERTGDTVGVLLGFKETPAEPTGFADEEKVAIPRLLRIAAGIPEYAPMDGKRAILHDRRSLQKLLGGAIPDGDPGKVVFAADVHGDSMAPGIADGDTLIVRRYFAPTRADKEKGIPIIESGKVYVLNLSAVEDDTDYEAKASVKRLILSGGHELHILSDNTKYPPRTVDLRRVRFIQGLVLGQPVKLIRDL